MKTGNLFRGIPDALPGELFETLASGTGPVRIERIVSRGNASPPDFWYDQDETEWVAVLSGSAVLRFADEPDVLSLSPADWVEIPAHVRHRVEATDENEDTVWLAVFWEEEGGGGVNSE